MTWTRLISLCPAMVVKQDQNELDPQTPTKTESSQFPALIFHRRASNSHLLANIPLYNLLDLPSSPSTKPSKMAGPIRTSLTDNRAALVQPPRPPNAWILYRSDKLRQLPPIPPGNPRRPQAEVSKLISHMWKSESDEVRAEFERRADAKKAEHQAMYPNYRFQPVKKEERERLREEKRLEKERERGTSRRSRARPAPYTPTVVAPITPHSIHCYHPGFHYGPSGLSPPLSASSSSNNTSPLSEMQQGQEDQSNLQPTHASPSTASPAHATPHALPTPSSLYNIPMPQAPHPFLHIAAPQPVLSQSSLPGPSRWQTPTQPQIVLPMAPSMAPTPVWPMFDPALLHNVTQPQDYVSFHLPSLATSNWMAHPSAVMNESVQAMLSGSGDPSIFELGTTIPDNLIAHPTGEVDVCLGQTDFAFDALQYNNELFNDFDFSSVLSETTSQSVGKAESNVSPSHPPSSFFSTDAGPCSTSQSDFNSFDNDKIFEYLNLEPSGPSQDEPIQTPAHPKPLSLVEQAKDGVNTIVSYVPPSGVPCSSTRRSVSWKQSFLTGPRSSVDRSPPRPWGVPAS